MSHSYKLSVGNYLTLVFFIIQYMFKLKLWIFVGKLDERNWKTGEDNPATIDDISVFVIPILPYKHEYAEWKSKAKPSQLNGNGVKEETGKALDTFSGESLNFLLKCFLKKTFFIVL